MVEVCRHDIQDTYRRVKRHREQDVAVPDLSRTR